MQKMSSRDTDFRRFFTDSASKDSQIFYRFFTHSASKDSQIFNRFFTDVSQMLEVMISGFTLFSQILHRFRWQWIHSFFTEIIL